MYLRRQHRWKAGIDYQYWTLVESVRTKRGPRQRIVATLGKLPGLDRQERIGWDVISRSISGKPREYQLDLFEESEAIPQWATVDLHGVRVERDRRFGDVYLGLVLWHRLELDRLCEKLMIGGREGVAWEYIACLLVVARFCEPSSELAIAESFYGKTALPDLLGVHEQKINDDRLYRCLDHLLPHKDAVCKHLQERYQDWFGVGFDFLIYDVTSTYFEGTGVRNRQAKRGYSRDHRPDCVQVCIGLVVTSEGLPVGYEVFDGNRADVSTLDEIVGLMETKYGRVNRVWVFDRGIVSDENLSNLRGRGADYVVGTPKSFLVRFEAELMTEGWHQTVSGVEVKTVKHPDFPGEMFILCRSQRRREKEKAILQTQLARLEGKLKQIQKAIRTGRLKDRAKAERRIGRWLGKHTRAESFLEVELQPTTGPLTDLIIRHRTNRDDWANVAHGAYLLRSNIGEENPVKVWELYMQLLQAEAAFRVDKSDLSLRPVYHQKTERVQAHIFVCFLALAMWKSLELWMTQKGLGSCARQLLKEFREIRSMDVILPVQNRNEIRLRVIGQPERHVKELLGRLGLALPNRPKMIEM